MISIEMQIQTSNLVSSVLLQLKDNFKSEMIKFIKIRQKACNPPILQTVKKNTQKQVHGKTS